MKYLALILFCLWVLSRALGAQEPAVASFAERFVEADPLSTPETEALRIVAIPGSDPSLETVP
jgi:hypothetical protein